jgi:hypothetical protein
VEAHAERHATGGVVLGEGRVGNHAVEAHQFAPLLVEWVAEGVTVLQVGVGDAVQNHVHLGDGPHTAVGLLAVQSKILGVSAVFAEVVGAHDEHAPRARAGVIHALPLLGVGDAHHHPHDSPRRIKLPAFLAGRVGKLADEVLVGRPQQVGKLEVFVEQSILIEVPDELSQPVIGQLRLAYGTGKVDVMQHPGKADILVLQRSQCLVEPFADAVVKVVVQLLPPRILRHEEGVCVVASGVGAQLGFGGDSSPRDLVFHDLRTACLKHVRAAFEKEHTKDVLFELRGIHLASENVRCLEQMPFELREGEFLHRCLRSLLGRVHALRWPPPVGDGVARRASLHSHRHPEQPISDTQRPLAPAAESRDTHAPPSQPSTTPTRPRRHTPRHTHAPVAAPRDALATASPLASCARYRVAACRNSTLCQCGRLKAATRP